LRVAKEDWVTRALSECEWTSFEEDTIVGVGTSLPMDEPDDPAGESCKFDEAAIPTFGLSLFGDRSPSSAPSAQRLG
jgi:hypothetical protein